jgi:hypothetical protein
MYGELSTDGNVHAVAAREAIPKLTYQGALMTAHAAFMSAGGHVYGKSR